MHNRKLPRLHGLAMGLLLVMSAQAHAGPLTDAAEQGDLDTVRRLLQEGIDVNEPELDGTTALHWAVHANDIGMAELLIAAGADANARNRVGAPPILTATINGNAEMLTLLLAAGADPNMQVSMTGDTPLMLAARTGVTEAVKVLLERGANVNARESWGQTTPLIWAVAENHAEVARLLIANGADLEARSVYVPPDTGRGFEGGLPRERRAEEIGAVIFASGELTPLLIAARDGHMDAVKVLVEAGANVNALAADGKNALGLSIFNGSYDIADYLVDAGSDLNQADRKSVV